MLYKFLVPDDPAFHGPARIIRELTFDVVATGEDSMSTQSSSRRVICQTWQYSRAISDDAESRDATDIIERFQQDPGPLALPHASAWQGVLIGTGQVVLCAMLIVLAVYSARTSMENATRGVTSVPAAIIDMSGGDPRARSLNAPADSSQGGHLTRFEVRASQAAMPQVPQRLLSENTAPSLFM